MARGNVAIKYKDNDTIWLIDHRGSIFIVMRNAVVCASVKNNIICCVKSLKACVNILAN